MPSPAAVDEAQWSDLESAMTDILSSYDDRAHAASAKRGLADLDSMASGPDRLRASSRTIAATLSSSIDDEKAALSSESEDVARRASRIQALEHEAAALEDSRAAMADRRRAAEESIPLHAAAADEAEAETDEAESRHVRMLPKVKQELSLHALMTNIKWEYGRTDVLAGEVAVPSRAVHRRFEIPKEELSEFEVAERLWRMMEG